MQDLFISGTSAIHAANTRVKFVLLVSTLVCISALPRHAWVAYGVLFCIFISLAWLARIPWKVLFARSLASLIFSAAALPIIFTQPGPKVLLTEIGALQVFVSQPGFTHFTSILVKSALSVVAAVIFTASTRFGDTLTALRVLGLPKELVSILSLMWRYLFLLIDETRNLARARQSRSGANAQTDANLRTLPIRVSTTGKMVGNLLLRSLERGERVYAAMCSRGYTGEPFRSEGQTWKRPDVIMMLVGLGFLVVLLATVTLITR